MYLTDVTSMLSHPGEIVVLHLCNFRGSGFEQAADHVCVLDVLTSIFPDHSTTFVKSSEFDLPYGDLVRRGRNVIVIYGNDEVVNAVNEKAIKCDGVELHSASATLCDKWFDAKNTKKLFAGITEFIPTMNSEKDRITGEENNSDSFLRSLTRFVLFWICCGVNTPARDFSLCGTAVTITTLTITRAPH